MATKTTNTTRALDALKTEYTEGAREFADAAELVAYVAELDVIVQEARDIKAFYKNKLAVIASQKSRAARQARVKEAMALLEAKEAAEAGTTNVEVDGVVVAKTKRVNAAA